MSFFQGPGAANPAADVVSCNTAMDACAKAAQWGRAFELKEQMGLNALKTDVITSSALLTACEGAAVSGSENPTLPSYFGKYCLLSLHIT